MVFDVIRGNFNNFVNHESRWPHSLAMFSNSLFLYGLSKSFTFEKCAAFGNVIAGEVLKVYGPRVEKSLKNLVMS